MKVSPLMTEKSLADAKSGSYTFIVDKGMTKAQIKKLISDVFSVNVTSVKTANIKASTKKNFKGQIKKIHAVKKAWVTLKEKEKIDLFEEKTK